MGKQTSEIFSFSPRVSVTLNGTPTCPNVDVQSRIGTILSGKIKSALILYTPSRIPLLSLLQVPKADWLQSPNGFEKAEKEKAEKVNPLVKVNIVTLQENLGT